VVPAPEGLWDFKQEAPRSSTRHITVKVPDGLTYCTGDHLAVYARNRSNLVDAALGRFEVAGDTLVRLGDGAARLRHLPLGQTITVHQLLEDYVDLQEPASKRVVLQLVDFTRCPNTRKELERLRGEAYAADIGDKRVTLLDLLKQHPAVEMPLAAFVAASPAIAPRFYSIASSPLVSPRKVELLVGTMSAPAWSGIGQHQGFASTYMRDVLPGDTVLGFVRSPNPRFAPPEDESVPMILIGPGTGFAPFRGFLQDRASMKAAGEAVGDIDLFFGCRHPDHDWLYRDEMEAWSNDEVAIVHLAFSAMPSHQHRFVQDALWAAQDKVWSAINAGAQIYVCGDGRYMAPAVRDTLIRIHMQQTDTTHIHSSAWLENMIDQGRYHQDVYGFGK
jgi:cytochrome P450 / NADPH-cytochrome P450 reductase